jgi:hypothetical protein
MVWYKKFGGGGLYRLMPLFIFFFPQFVDETDSFTDLVEETQIVSPKGSYIDK